MKNKLISTIVIGILTASILNTPTLAKYIQSFEPLKETIVAYEMQKTDVHIQHINKNTNEIIEEEILNDIEIDTVLVSNEYKKDISGYKYDGVESEIVQVTAQHIDIVALNDGKDIANPNIYPLPHKEVYQDLKKYLISKINTKQRTKPSTDQKTDLINKVDK